jgi:hypothetical protein
MTNSKTTALTKLVEDEYKNISALVIFKDGNVAYLMIMIEMALSISVCY